MELGSTYNRATLRTTAQVSGCNSTAIRLAILLTLLIPAIAYGQLPNPGSPQGQVAQAQPHQSSAQTHKPSPSQVPAAILGVPNASTQKVGTEKETADSGNPAKPPTHDTYWAEWIIAIATVIYAFFAALQWRALRKTVDETQGLVKTADRQAKAAENQVVNLERTLIETGKAADAAYKSAMVADSALRADRPFLLIESPELNYFQPTSRTSANILPISVKFTFRNCGKSPAIISKILARLAVVKTPRPISTDAGLNEDDFPRIGEYERCRWVDIRENVISADEQSTPYAVQLETTRSDVERGKINDETFEQIGKHALLIVLHGIVRYSDILQRRHETEFLGAYSPPDADAIYGRFYCEFADRQQRD